MSGLLEIVVILWKSIHRSLEKNKEARLYTVDKFACVLPEYLKVFQVRQHIWKQVGCSDTGAELAEAPDTPASPVKGGAKPALPWGRLASSLPEGRGPGPFGPQHPGDRRG